MPFVSDVSAVDCSQWKSKRQAKAERELPAIKAVRSACIEDSPTSSPLAEPAWLGHLPLRPAEVQSYLL